MQWRVWALNPFIYKSLTSYKVFHFLMFRSYQHLNQTSLSHPNTQSTHIPFLYFLPRYRTHVGTEAGSSLQLLHGSLSTPLPHIWDHYNLSVSAALTGRCTKTELNQTLNWPRKTCVSLHQSYLLC